MKLTFPKDIVAQLIKHTAEAADHKTLYGEDKGAGLWLVGDQGVYLMSNAATPLQGHKDERNVVAYADQVNPDKLDFDEWYGNKRRSFGGDDGVEFISLDSLNPDGEVTINISASEFTVKTNKRNAA